MKRKTFILLCVILSALFISSCKICVDPKTNPNDPNYNQQEKIDGKKTQEIDIYYRGVGIISFPVSLEDMTMVIEKMLNKKISA